MCLLAGMGPCPPQGDSNPNPKRDLPYTTPESSRKDTILSCSRSKVLERGVLTATEVSTYPLGHCNCNAISLQLR